MDCYEAIHRIQAGLHTEYIPNARAIAQLLSGKPPNDQSHEALVTYARACVQPGLEYFQWQLATSLKGSLDVFKGCRLFSPQKVHIMQPTTSTVDEDLKKTPFLNTPQELNDLKEELPTHLARASDTNENFDILEWWKRNSSHLPKWSAAAKRIFLIQPSSAASERGFCC